MTVSKNIFAERLEKLIKENNYTHENVAKGIDVTRQAVGKWVKGDSVPDVLTAAKLAKFFKVSVDYLAGISPHRTSDKDLSAVCEYTGLSEEAVEKLIGKFNNLYAFDDGVNKAIEFSPFMDCEGIVSDILKSEDFWEIVLSLKHLYTTTLGYSKELMYKIITIPRELLDDESKLAVDNIVFADIYRYDISRRIEKISDMFDNRVKVETEVINNANHNPKKE